MKSTFLRLLGAAISRAAAAAVPCRKLLRVVDMSTILFLPCHPGIRGRPKSSSDFRYLKTTRLKAHNTSRPSEHVETRSRLVGYPDIDPNGLRGTCAGQPASSNGAYPKTTFATVSGSF